MEPRPVVPADLGYWADESPRVVTFRGPPGVPDVGSCEVVVTMEAGGSRDGAEVVRVPWSLDEGDRARLAAGGTLWLSTWVGLPPHMLEVAPSPEPFAGGVVDALHIDQPAARSELGPAPDGEG